MAGLGHRLGGHGVVPDSVAKGRPRAASTRPTPAPNSGASSTCCGRIPSRPPRVPGRRHHPGRPSAGHPPGRPPGRGNERGAGRDPLPQRWDLAGTLPGPGHRLQRRQRSRPGDRTPPRQPARPGGPRGRPGRRANNAGDELGGLAAIALLVSGEQDRDQWAAAREARGMAACAFGVCRPGTAITGVVAAYRCPCQR
jgi:hypothetical protein